VLSFLAVLGFVVSAAATPLPARTDRSIYDAAGVIDDAAEARLENMHRELFSKSGVAIVLVTVPRLENETIDQLAVRVGQGWGVGRKGQDRGLVVAFALEDRKIYVATGYGTEEYLPDGRIGAILDRYAVPSLRLDRFSEGLVALDEALVAASAEQYGVTVTGAPPPPPRTATDQPGPGSLVFIVLALVVFVWMARRHPRLLGWFVLGNLLGGRRGRGGDDDFGGSGGGFGGFGGGGFGGGGAGRSF